MSYHPQPWVLIMVRSWFLAALVCLTAAASLSAQADLGQLEELAFRAAVSQAAPSVVRIETVGGLEQLGKHLVGTGPTTGVIVSEDGYVVSSAFSFANKPSTILVGLPDGTRAAGKIVATDHARMLVLLKVDVQEKLPVPEAVPADEMAVGQWAIAIGRTFEGQQPNMSVGIVSALNRIYGRALQTDAKISPNNYGGALVDLRGRVLGILVPLSATGADKLSGVEWYDSGIGFAVPFEHVLSVFPRFKAGKDLHPGILGISLKAGDQFADPAEIGVVRANSPAFQAGMKTGDQIVELAGKPVTRQSQVKEALGPLYAGDKVTVAFKRGDEVIRRELTLIETLEPYSRPFLGVLPLRVAAASEEADDQANNQANDNKAPVADPARSDGITVRYVYPGSPAQTAGLEAGDRITQVNGKPVADRDAFREAIAGLDLTAKIKLAVSRGASRLNIESGLADQPETIPDKLPPAMANRKPYLGQQPPVGTQPRKVAEFANEASIYVPEGYDPAVPHGVVVWFHGPGELQTEEEIAELVKRWQPLCDANDLILVLPKSEDSSKWVPAKELPFAAKLVSELRNVYRIDNARVVSAGFRTGAAMAMAFAANQRELVRAVALVDGPVLSSKPPENDPLHPLAFLITSAKEGRAKPEQLEQVAKVVRDMKYPVTMIDQGEAGRHLNDAELNQLVRWVDSLDRI